MNTMHLRHLSWVETVLLNQDGAIHTSAWGALKALTFFYHKYIGCNSMVS